MYRQSATLLILLGLVLAIVPAWIDARSDVLTMGDNLAAIMQTLAGAVLGVGLGRLELTSKAAEDARLDCQDIDRTLTFLRESREAGYDEATKAVVVQTMRFTLSAAENSLLSARDRIASRAKIETEEG